MKSEILDEDYILSIFPCSIGYGDESGLEDDEERALEFWLNDLEKAAKKRYGPDVCLVFEYGDESEFEPCAILGVRGDCVAVTVTALY